MIVNLFPSLADNSVSIPYRKLLRILLIPMEITIPITPSIHPINRIRIELWSEG